MDGQEQKCKICSHRAPLDCAKTPPEECACLSISGLPSQSKTKSLLSRMSFSDRYRLYTRGMKENWSAWEWEQYLKS